MRLIRLFFPVIVCFGEWAQAQSLLTGEAFDSASSEWIAYGDGGAPSLWHWASDQDFCLQAAGSQGAQGGVMYMGSDVLCNFVFAGSGEYLEYMPSIAVPAGVGQVRLDFDSYADSEGCALGVDEHRVEISVDNGASWQEVGQACVNMRDWTPVSLDLSPWQGLDVRLRFAFYKGDDVANDGLGWVIDNVILRASDCLAYNYCHRSGNSHHSGGATIGYSGVKRIHMNDFTLTVQDAPPGQFAYFFYGTGEIQVHLASGYLCVSTDSSGYRRLHPGGSIDAGGHFEWALDFPTLLNQYTIDPGSTWKFQCWYRDQVGGQGTSNFSDGLSVTFCP
ncbi:MAG: hypothetical protein R3F33_14375 [Planctomycetota bacterium]